MNYLIISYSILSFLLFYLCARFSYKFRLVDLPGKRKTHSSETAYTGGVAISFTLIFSILLFDNNNILNLILSMAFLVSIIGLIDDKYNLNVGSKLCLQVIPIIYLILFQDLILDHLGDYNYFILNIGSFAIPFTLICALFLINSFNYFDGIDGTLSLLASSILGILYLLIPDQEFQFYIFIILIPLCIFVLFNFSILKLPKMFLGDSGSLLLGFIFSFVLIYVAKQNLLHPIVLAWSIVIFVYEFLSINLIRLKNNQNLFTPGKDHLHHILLKHTRSIFYTNFIIIFLNIILFTIGYVNFLFTGSLFSLIIFILLFIVYFILRNKYRAS